jgi:hypothetical protein
VAVWRRARGAGALGGRWACARRVAPGQRPAGQGGRPGGQGGRRAGGQAQRPPGRRRRRRRRRRLLQAAHPQTCRLAGCCRGRAARRLRRPGGALHSRTRETSWHSALSGARGEGRRGGRGGACGGAGRSCCCAARAARPPCAPPAHLQGGGDQRVGHALEERPPALPARHRPPNVRYAAGGAGAALLLPDPQRVQRLPEGDAGHAADGTCGGVRPLGGEGRGVGWRPVAGRLAGWLAWLNTSAGCGRRFVYPARTRIMHSSVHSGSVQARCKRGAITCNEVPQAGAQQLRHLGVLHLAAWMTAFVCLRVFRERRQSSLCNVVSWQSCWHWLWDFEVWLLLSMPSQTCSFEKKGAEPATLQDDCRQQSTPFLQLPAPPKNPTHRLQPLKRRCSSG